MQSLPVFPASLRRFGIFCLLTLTQSVASADESVLLLGIGVSSESSPWVGGENGTSLVPFFSYQKGRLSFAGTEVSWDLFDGSSTVSLDLSDGSSTVSWDLFDGASTYVYTFLEPSSVDWEGNKGLEHLSRRNTVDLGFTLEQDLPNDFEVEVNVIFDAKNVHGGHKLDLAFLHEINQGNYEIELSAGASYLSDALSQYHFGVDTADASALTPAWQSAAAWIPTAEISLIRYLTEQSGLVLSYEYQSLHDLRDSPLLAKDHVQSLSLLWISEF